MAVHSEEYIRGYDQGRRDAFPAALHQAHHEVQRRLLLLQKANHYLWDMLCELDSTEPLIGVKLNRREVLWIIKKLRLTKADYYWSNKLTKKLQEAEKMGAELSDVLIQGNKKGRGD